MAAPRPTASLRLVGDIGGTNARFAVANGGAVGEMTVLPTADHPTFEAAVRAFLANCPDRERIGDAAFAIAGPADGDSIVFTNRDWRFSVRELQARLSLRQLVVVNDFTANALALPYLQPADVEQVGGGKAVSERPIGILGPGTGLGVSGMIWAKGTWVPLSGEGGHATLAAGTEREARIIDQLRATHGHVSAERALCGAGLLDVYRALAAIDKAPVRAKTPAEVTATALDGSDAVARETVATFCALLGSFAGNLALTLGAQGGVFIAGGIVPRFGKVFAQSEFRSRFEAKGRFRPYLAAIPTSVVVSQKNLAMVGLANLP